MQPETRDLQHFGAKFGASVAKPQSGGRLPTKNFAHKGTIKIDLKARFSFFERAINRLSDLSSLEDNAVKFLK